MTRVYVEWTRCVRTAVAVFSAEQIRWGAEYVGRRNGKRPGGNTITTNGFAVSPNKPAFGFAQPCEWASSTNSIKLTPM